jgi:dihydrofolate synthase/folylpolyglutamate synthase
VIAEIARQHGSRMSEAGDDFHYTYHPPKDYEKHDRLGRLDFSGDLGSEDAELTGIPLRMLGEHQAENAALAIAITARLRKQGWSISSNAIRATFSKLILPGRIELVRRHPAVVLDVAHNVAAVEALVDVITTSFSCEQRILILAATKDKDVRGIVRTLVPYFQRIIVTEYQINPRAVAAETLGDLVREELAGLNLTETVVAEEPQPADAWRLARELAGPEQLICITGSFFIAAELRHALLANA